MPENLLVEKGESVPLKVGTKIALNGLNFNAPIYLVEAIDTANKQIRLALLNRSTNCPEVIEGGEIKLGRNHQPEMDANPTVSRQHATLYFGTDGQAHYYHQGQNPARFAVLNTEGEASQAIADGKKRMLALNLYKEQIQEVARLETGTRYSNLTTDVGYYANLAAQGQEQMVLTFMHAHAGLLSGEQQQALNRFGMAMREVADLPPRNFDPFEALRSFDIMQQRGEEFYGYNRELDQYIDRKIQTLNANKEVHFKTGHKGHHITGKIFYAEDGTYRLAIYNAGEHTQLVSDDPSKSFVMVEHVIRDPRDVRSVLALHAMRVNTAAEECSPIDNEILARRTSFMSNWRAGDSQGKSNCATRGNREVLRDMLGSSQSGTYLFDAIYSYIAGRHNTPDHDKTYANYKHMQDLEETTRAITRAGHTRLEQLTPIPTLGIDAYTRAMNPSCYQTSEVALAGKRIRADVYQTVPGTFHQNELQALQVVLRNNGIESTIQNGDGQQKRPFLYILNADHRNFQSVEQALRREQSPAADAYRQWGEKAPQITRQLRESSTGASSHYSLPSNGSSPAVGWRASR